MDVEIREPVESDDLNDEMDELLSILVMAFGSGLPDTIEGITKQVDRYDLHLNSTDFGNAYGEVLATHGWTIVGFHSYQSGGDDVDTVSVRRIENCDNRNTIMYEAGDKGRILFER